MILALALALACTDASFIGASPAKEGYCPPEMSPIRDASGALLYCMDTWEVTVSGRIGLADQVTNGPDTLAVAVSKPGELPVTKLSFGQARAACANTPVYDKQGNIAGYKRLPTSSEWFDAADGVVGAGGSRYVFGDEYQPGVCACRNKDQSTPYPQAQPAGSLPGCVSAFGVYDQSGNVWEWVDPEQTIHIQTWWEKVEPIRPELKVDEEGFLYLTEGEPVGLTTEIAGVAQKSFRVGEGGYLMVKADPSVWDFKRKLPTGYLENIRLGGAHTTQQYLPIQVVPLDLKALHKGARLRVMSERDGHPFAEKVGGAFYNTYDACQVIPKGLYTHPHDFDGTIGFRCAADPVFSP